MGKKKESATKDSQTMIRLTTDQRKFLDDEAAKLGLSNSEFIRRLIQDYNIPDKVLVSFPVVEELKFVQDLATELNVTPSNAIRISLIQFRTIMQAPLSVILRPTEEVLAELTKINEECQDAN